MQLTKLHWLSALFAFAVISGIVIHLMLPARELPNNSIYSSSVNEGYQTKSVATGAPQEIDDTYTVADSHTDSAKAQRLTALTIKLAELQSQVLRLNALGERLAEDAKIPEREFNFNKLPPTGGPALEAEAVDQKSFAQLLKEINLLETKMKYEEKQLQLLESLTFGHHIENNRYLSGRPISKGWLSSYYGVRKDPFHGRPSMHKGIDFAGKEDAEIIATASGVVSWSSKRYGYGQLIEIDHGDGLKTRYGHNKTLLVEVGDVVNKGQIIARMGSTGRSTGPHVHYEILRNNSQIDPTKYVYRKAK
jgi:murein DD-endopeptidase MepM/ murein hydrolase activator NlpD